MNTIPPMVLNAAVLTAIGLVPAFRYSIAAQKNDRFGMWSNGLAVLGVVSLIVYALFTSKPA